MWKILFFIDCMLVLIPFSGFSQFNETIRSGRPGQSIGPFTVGARVMQIQSGVDVYGFENEGNDLIGHGFVHNTVVRYGLLERLELSGLFDYRDESWKSNTVEQEANGLSAFDLGGRYAFYDGGGAIPSMGFQIRIRLPILSEDYKIDHIGPRFVFVTGQKLSNTFTLTTNWGVNWNGVDSNGTAFYVVNLSFPISGKWGGFVENYGEISGGDFDSRFDAGLAYLGNNDLQFDVLGGFGGNDGVNDYFIGTGFSWRTKRK